MLGTKVGREKLQPHFLKIFFCCSFTQLTSTQMFGLGLASKIRF